MASGVQCDIAVRAVSQCALGMSGGPLRLCGLNASYCRSHAPANMFRRLSFAGRRNVPCILELGRLRGWTHETCRQFGTMFRTCCAKSSSFSASGACTCGRVSFHPSHDAADAACSKALSKLSKKMEVPSFSNVNSSLSQAKQLKMP